MLYICIPGTEFYDESKNIFIHVKECELRLEHSLVSLYKWESKWKKPFLREEPMTQEETIDYIRFMTITQNVDPNIYYALTDDNIRAVMKYIEDPMTATWFKEEKKRPSREIMTAERIYSQMIALGVPFECQKWHLNKLLTLIKVCAIEQSPKKKMSPGETLNHYKALNAARLQKRKPRL